MLIRTPSPSDVVSSEITPETAYLNRRQLLAGMGLIATGLALPSVAHAEPAVPTPPLAQKLTRSVDRADKEALTNYGFITQYNNFYEFGSDKLAPAQNATRFRTTPWSVSIGGECESPGTLTLEDLLRPHAVEERIYRLRCVEGWSMVIPWAGFQLGDLLKRFKPTANARYVAFTTLLDPAQMPGTHRDILDWPYREGLRIDEAMHPLTILAIGLYGRVLPNQNGAPLRLVVPWKYGFKSIKSIVRIDFVERQPKTSWNLMTPTEYAFYSNVNPEVDHPRWSQKSERRIGEMFKRDTRLFNGYAEVAPMYAGMNLKKYF